MIVLATARTSTGQMLQLSVEIDESNAAAKNAISCPHKASAKLWWVNTLKTFEVDAVSNIKILAGHITKTGVVNR